MTLKNRSRITRSIINGEIRNKTINEIAQLKQEIRLSRIGKQFVDLFQMWIYNEDRTDVRISVQI